MSIEGFRSLNADIETIINKSEHVKQTKKTKDPSEMTPKEKKELTEEEKEYKSKRKEIQEKLIKFATRIPVFMYLTDFREYSLMDVIRQLEPELFRKVTGLTLKDFDLLVSLGVFNRDLMNDAVYKFKRYEDSSLEYTGINTHTGTIIGGWDTVMDTAVIKEEPAEESNVTMKMSDKTPEVSTEEEVKVTIPKEEPWERLKVGDKVIHKSFGPGQVVSLDDNYVFVKFNDRESKFLFPNAFEKEYLSCMTR